MGELVTDSKLWGGHAEDGESAMTGSAAKAERQEQYLQWLLTPRELRDPKTKTALAEQLDCSLHTLCAYDRERAFQRRVSSERNRLGRVERASDILDALYARSLSETNPAAANAAAKLFLEFTHRSLEDGPSSVDVSAMSDEQIAEVAISVLNSLAKRSD